MADNPCEQPDQPGSTSSLTFRPFIPHQPRYAARVSEQQWDNVRPTLDSLHQAGKTRACMLNALADLHDFKPSLPQLNARMVAWGYKVSKPATTTNQVQSANEPSTAGIEIATGEDQHTLTNAAATTHSADGGIVTDGVDIITLDNLIRHRAYIILPISWCDKSGYLCICYDITKILARSTWCSSSFRTHVRHLIHLVKVNDMCLTGRANALVVRDFLSWSLKTNDAYSMEWIFERCEKHVIDAGPGNSQRLRLLLSRCRTVYAARDSSTAPGNTINDEDMMQSLSALSAELNSSLPQRLVLYPDSGRLHAKRGCKNLSIVGDAELIHAIIAWCRREIESFGLNPALRWEDARSFRCNHPCFLHTALTRHFVDQWTHYTYVCCPHSVYRPSWTNASWFGLSLFASITEVLTSVSFLAVQNSRKALQSVWPGSQDLGDTEVLSVKIIQVLKLALQDLEWHAEDVREQLGQYEKGFGCDIQVVDVTRHALDYAITFANETWELKQTPNSMRHQRALYGLVNETEGWKRAQRNSNNNADPMLSQISSTSSLRSFRRAGIKLEHRFGPPSVSSGSSKYSFGSSVHMIAECEMDTFILQAPDG